MYWHFFVLHTPEYIEFSIAVFGDYGPQPRVGRHYFKDVSDKRAAVMEHRPSTDETRPNTLEAYLEVLDLYRSIYGTMDERYWPTPRKGVNEVPTCGDSYSGAVLPVFAGARS